jgi:Na+/H+-translocating membrane pyrophosphatase
MVSRGIEFTRNGVIGAIAVGLVVGALMSIITEYYTAMGKRPVLSIIRQSQPDMLPILLVVWPLVWNLHFCR